MRVRCPGCQSSIHASEQMAGEKIACPRCHKSFRLPTPATASRPAARSRAARSPAARKRSLWLPGLLAAGLLLAAGAGVWALWPRSPKVQTQETSPESTQVAKAPTRSSARPTSRSTSAPAPAPRPTTKSRPPEPAPAPPPKKPERQPEKTPDPPLRPAEPAATVKPIIYPAPDQEDVPLWFPGNEIPDPLPQTKEKLAGYPITITFPWDNNVEKASGKLDMEGVDVAVWLSAPDEPANKKFVEDQANTICLIARSPLKPGTRYHVHVRAQVDGKEWKREWAFRTISQDSLDRKVSVPFVELLNRTRRQVGLAPLPRDAEQSHACADHIRYILRNVAEHPDLNWNDEEPKLPGYTGAGAEAARRAFIYGGGGPQQAVAGIVNSFLSREQLLTPDVEGLGLGYGPFFGGGYIWMAVLQRKRIPRNTPEVLYPFPDQKEVPLRYPAEDQPSPIPKEHGNKPAGYAITAWFPYQTPIREPQVEMVDEEDKQQDGWLSAPGKPAIDDYKQQCSICFLPKKPLRPNTTYTVSFSAQVDGRAWKRTWSFTTWKDPEAPDPGLSQRLLAEVNACRKNAGLPLVQLDETLSQGCRQHARYLILNKDNRATEGLKMHKEDPSLPGYSREGARAAGGLIAAIGNPDAAVGDWLATLYHRLPLLNPRLQRIGLACLRYPDGKWACVLDTVNGKKSE